MDGILLWAVQLQGQWRSISTGLSPDRHRGRPPHPSQRSGPAVLSLKKGKSAGVDNIPTELVQAGGEDIMTALMTICIKVWQTGEWQTPLALSLVITYPKKGNLQQCQNYWTISLISHPRKVVLKIILNRLKPQTKKIIAEAQARFRAGRSNTDQIFNVWILRDKYLQHQGDFYYVFINFKKARERVWPAA